MTWALDKTSPIAGWLRKHGDLTGRVWVTDYGSVKGMVILSGAPPEMVWSLEWRVERLDRDIQRMRSMTQNVMETRRLAANKPKREPANRNPARW